jgi:hypothetical protein
VQQNLLIAQSDQNIFRLTQVDGEEYFTVNKTETSELLTAVKMSIDLLNSSAVWICRAQF